MINDLFKKQTRSCCYVVYKEIRTMGRKFFNTFMYLATCYMTVYSGLVIYNSHFDTRQTVALQSQTRMARGGVTKLLFLSYSRAGSSISSEIFDVDERAIFWYEPLEAFYFAKTGYYGRKDQKALMLQNETEFRPIQAWEHREITDFFNQLYSCRLTGLPPEFLAHRFLKHSTALSRYYQCYQQLSPDTITNDLDACRDHLKNVCGKSVHSALRNNCLDLMTTLRNVRVLTSSQRDRYLEDYVTRAGMEGTRAKRVLRRLLAYRSCLDPLEDVTDKCLYKAEQACVQKRLRAIKVVRLSMDVVETMLTSIPELRVVFFVRDPRAMAYSRAGKRKDDYDILNNLRLICMKLRLDIAAARDINKQRPLAILVVKYEDFVQAPQLWTTKMYQHIGYDTPTGLDQFIRTHMFSGQDDGKKWGNIRPNATELANGWRHLVPADLLSTMQSQCMDVIKALEYEVY